MSDMQGGCSWINTTVCANSPLGEYFVEIISVSNYLVDKTSFLELC